MCIRDRRVLDEGQFLSPYGVAQGYLVKVEPEQFTVREGKLYLNYDADVQSKWLKDPEGFNREADQKFEALLKQ